MHTGQVRFRFNRGRRPDPHREGTVYRARPGFRLRGDSSDGQAGQASPSWPAADPAAPRTPEEFWAAQGDGYPGASGAGPGLQTRVDPTSPRDGAPSSFGLPDKGRRRWRLHPLRWLIAVVLLYPIVLATLAWTGLTRIAAMPTSDRPVDSPGTTFLVIGSDSRQDLSRDERARLGTGQATGIRTDTMMLLHLATDGSAVLVSIPRDSYVPIPGHGKDKINAAYSYGGPKLTVRTVEQATGLRIDDFVMTGLGSFANVVDAVGGVRVCPKTAIKDAKAHINVPKGCQTMNGPTALGYARARYSDPRGDLGRVERQREVLAAIASKTLSPSVLAVPWRAAPAARAGGKALTVDEGTTPWGLGRFVLGMRRVSGGDGVRMTVPIADPDLSTPSGSAVKWDSGQADRLFRAIKANDLTTIRAIAAAQQKS